MGKFLRSVKQFLAELVEMVVLSLVIIVPIRFFIIQPFFVKGQSMEPSFHENNYLIIDELSYRLREPSRGDVIVLRAPQPSDQFFLKRLIGLPGETVEINNGKVFIASASSTFQLVEPYLPPGELTEGNIRVALGDSQYFVLGDNRKFSYDSRRWGLLDRKEIIGRVWERLWPPAQAAVFAAPDIKEIPAT
jgi:signal peptidase I